MLLRARKAGRKFLNPGPDYDWWVWDDLQGVAAVFEQ